MAEKLATLAATLERNPEVAGVFSDAALIDDRGTPQPGALWSDIHFGPREMRQFKRDQTFFLTRRPLVTGACFAFRSSLSDAFKPIPSEFVHDGWNAMCLSTRGKLQPISEKLISYRIHGTQQLGLKGVSKREALQRDKDARVLFHRDAAKRYRLAAAKLAQTPAARFSARYAEAKANYMDRRVALLGKGRLSRIFQGLMILPGHFRFSWGPVSYLRDLLHG